MTFNISKMFDEWVAHFEAPREIQAIAGINPLFLRLHEDDPQKACIVMQIEVASRLEAFMNENEEAILESGHLLETMQSNTHLSVANFDLTASAHEGEAMRQRIWFI